MQSFIPRCTLVDRCVYVCTYAYAYMRAVKRCTVKYAVIESDVLALLLRDFFFWGGMEIGCWLRENLRKMRCCFRWGHWIVYSRRREEGASRRRRREKKSKRDAGESFLFYCVCFWFVEKESLHLPLYITYLDPGIHLRARGTFSTWSFLFCYHYLLGVFWELAIYLFQTYTWRKEGGFFFKSFFTPCQG